MPQPRDLLDPHHDLSAPEWCFLLIAGLGAMVLIGAVAFYKLAM